MILEEHVPLARLTTLKVGGEARFVATCESIEEVREALALSREQGIPFYMLGEGSNVLASDEGYEGVIIRMRIGGISFEDEGMRMLVTSGAGVPWDELVRESAARGLWGIENLAGIPGTVGAAPVQNIGAYGTDLSMTLVSVDTVSIKDGTVVRLTKEECALGYRDSRFKHSQEFIITGVTLSLAKEGSALVTYGDLLRAKEADADFSTPEKVGEIVRGIRAGKFPNLETHGTAGSFFKNPIITEEKYAELVEKLGAIPRFPNTDGVKIPLAFVLDRALNLRGFRMARAWLFGSQPLVLVLDKGGQAHEIETLARFVEEQVQKTLGITIEREVRSIPKNNS